MKLSPTEQFAINRKSLASLAVSCDTKTEALRRDFATFTQEVSRLLQMKRLKHAKIVLLESEEEK